MSPGPRNMWERHFQTAVGVLVVTLGIWLFQTTQHQTIIIAVQTEKIIGLTNRFLNMEQLIGQRYSSADAKRDFALRDSAIERLEDDFETLRKFHLPEGF